VEHVGVRILAACESQTAGADTARLLGKLTFPAGSVGRTISVVQSMFAGQIPAWLESQARSSETEAMAALWVQEHADELAAKRKEMAEYCRQLPAIFQQSEPIVAEGHPAEVILKNALSESADLLVVGARQAGSMARLLMGSTSEAVLAHAPCSVLIVRRTSQP
jgi:nucleotide-binding universal stress UspA family protein